MGKMILFASLLWMIGILKEETIDKKSYTLTVQHPDQILYWVGNINTVEILQMNRKKFAI